MAELPPSIDLPALKTLALHAPSRRALEPRALCAEPQRPAQVAFQTAGERAVVAVALYALRELATAGASRLDPSALERALKRSWSGLPPQERVAIEVEVYDMLEHLGLALGLPGSAPPEAPAAITPQSSHLEVARWALRWAEDLYVERYDQDSGELKSYRITPLSLEAGAYLRAISHTTREERVFSLKQLGTMRPVDGWTMHHQEGALAPRRPAPKESEADGQLSLLPEGGRREEEE